MKKYDWLIKIMFGASVMFTALFVIFYIWGINNCADFSALTDCTLPFFLMSFISMAGFGAAGYLHAAKSAAFEAKNAVKSVKTKTLERRYIIKTYGRNGSFQTKRINVRGDYGLLKSA